MADISYTYKDSVFTLNSYDDVLRTYAWIENAINFVFKESKNKRVSFSVDFEAEELSYSCCSISEFKRYAFGKKIQIRQIHFLVYEGCHDVTLGLHASYSPVYAKLLKEEDWQRYTISSNDEILISRLKEALQNRSEIAVVSIEPRVIKYEDNSVYIGDNNTISQSAIGRKNNVSVIENHTLRKEPWYLNLFWQIVVGVVVAIICALIGLRQ